MNILVIGGGAGGLELVTRLGDKLGRKNKAVITLVDKDPTHIWKPLLHEVATGSLDAGIDEVSYRAHAHNHHFQFVLGSFSGLDRERKVVELAALLDEEGATVLPPRELPYDYLVLAIGSVSNDFGVPGVKQHCTFLDSQRQAHRFQKRLVNAFLRLNQELEKNPEASLRVAIVGGGATGVELAAELFNAAHLFQVYGLDAVEEKHLDVTLLEAGPRILPALPERIAHSAHQELSRLGVKVLTQTQVVAADPEGLRIKTGETIAADIMVWAAGVKAVDFINNIGGLENGRNNQLLVKPTLQTTRDDSVFVLGDCAACPQSDGKFVPPRAQAAHQMAAQVYKNILAVRANKPLQPYVYRDHGSLISLSNYTTVGSLMGNLSRGSMMIEGRIARIAYISLYRMHQIAIHGWFRTALITVVERINHVLRPRLKLH